MAKFDDKVNGNTVDATEYNNIVRASKNAIEDSGQVINDVDNTQVSKAMANYAGASTYYTDSGIADAYVLNPVGSFKAPTAYVDGLEFRFRAGNVNTGASTANPGGLGVKNIKLQDGTTDVAAGDIPITSDTILRYDSSNDVLISIKQTIEGATNSTAGISILPNQIKISNGTDADHDIDFTAGSFIFSDGSGQAVASALTKQIDATWAAGDNSGGLADALTVANDTWYHCFALSKADGSSTDFGFDTSVTATNLLVDTAVVAAGLTKYTRIGSILSDGSANIIGFTQSERYFYFNSRIQDLSTTTPATSKTNLTVSTPDGIDVVGIFNFQARDTSNTYTNFFGSGDSDRTPAADDSDFYCQGADQNSDEFQRLSSSGTISYRTNNGTMDAFLVYVRGWIDINL